MRRLAALAGLALVLATAATALPAAGASLTVAPPALGTWRIVADSSDGTPPISDFKGSFVVSGSQVTKVAGTITHTYPHDEGCVKGTKLTVLDSQPILHILVPGAEDEYAVSKKAPGTYVPVAIRLKAGTQSTVGTLDIRFNSPGQIPTVSSLTFGNTIGCHLRFDVTH